MKCKKCDREAGFIVQELKTDEKTIVCHVHFIDLCAFMVKNATEFLLKRDN